MQYTYSLCEPFNPIGNHFFPFYCFSQQQVQPTTILISNSEFSHEPEKESETPPKLIRSQTTLGERSTSPEAKKKAKKVGKLIKKESTMKKDESFGFRNQNKDRNLLSSILKGYVYFILHNRGMIKLIETLAKRQQL